MKYELSEIDKRLIDRVSKITGVNYEIDNDNYIEAVYHSTSNGKTESSQDVWGNYYPYLISVDSDYDIGSGLIIHKAREFDIGLQNEENEKGLADRI